MNGLTLMAVVIVCLWLGYHFYGRWLEKTWGIDPNAKTPAALRNDGKDYQPASRLSVFAHQFTSITGAGPVTGPIIAAMFGWLPALCGSSSAASSSAPSRTSRLSTPPSGTAASPWA